MFASAPSESIGDEDGRESAYAPWPNATTETASPAHFARRNDRAACFACASGPPSIDRDRSMPRTTAFEQARFWALRPVTGSPFSRSTGWAPAPADETTVAWIVGYLLASTPRSATPADAVAGRTSKAAAKVARASGLRALIG